MFIYHIGIKTDYGIWAEFCGSCVLKEEGNHQGCWIAGGALTRLLVYRRAVTNGVRGLYNRLFLLLMCLVVCNPEGPTTDNTDT